MKFGTMMHFRTQLLAYSSNLYFSTILYGNLMWLESTRHAGNYFVTDINTTHFFVAEVMSIYLTTDGLKKFSPLPEAPRGLRPVAFATSATWLIRHCLYATIRINFQPSVDCNFIQLLVRVNCSSKTRKM